MIVRNPNQSLEMCADLGDRKTELGPPQSAVFEILSPLWD